MHPRPHFALTPCGPRATAHSCFPSVALSPHFPFPDSPLCASLPPGFAPPSLPSSRMRSDRQPARVLLPAGLRHGAAQLAHLPAGERRAWGLRGQGKWLGWGIEGAGYSRMRKCGRVGMRACGNADVWACAHVTRLNGACLQMGERRSGSECNGTREHDRELSDANHCEPACCCPTTTAALPCLACHPSLSFSLPVSHRALPLAHHSPPSRSPSPFLFPTQGGAWCYSVRSCRRRALTLLGSSSLWPHPSHPDFNTQLKRLTGYGMDGMLHVSAAVNPRFFNWHVVLIAYCDGAAFSGTRGHFNASRSASLVAGGRSILKSVIRHMRVARGMKGAQRVVVAGCSAGAQAVAMQCDALARLLPTAAAKRCIMDGGFFPDMRDVSGTFFMRKVAQRLVAIHNISADPDCLKGEGPDARWRCFFPEHGLRYVTTPLLLVNSVNDADAINLLNLHSPTRRRLRRCLASLAGGSRGRCAKEDVGMALAYAIRVAGLARQVAQQNPVVKPFLYRERMHCATLVNRWSTVQGDGGGLRDVLGSWAMR
ncbi:unnamed protein product [Closterium sp. NIES-53]